MKNKIVISLALITSAGLLSGCGIYTSQHSSKSSAVVSKSSTNSPNEVYGQKLNDNNFYVLAYAKLDNKSLDTLLAGSKEWKPLQDGPYSNSQANYAFCIQDGNGTCIDDNTDSNEGATKLVKISKNNVTISHLEGNSPDTPHYKYKYKDITYSKKELIQQFIHSKEDINKLQQITKNMEKNESSATNDFQEQKTDDNSTRSSSYEVDTTKLNKQQVNNWVYKALITTDYTGTNKPPMSDFIFAQYLDDDSNDLEICVKTKANTPQNKNNNDKRITLYRINSAGVLQENDESLGGGNWEDTNVPYPGK